MLATLMRGALLADALDDPPAAPLGAAPAPLLGVPEDDPLLLAIVPVTCTRLSTWGESSDAVPSSAYVRPAADAPAAPDEEPAAPGVPAPDVPAAPGFAVLDPLAIVASVRMNDATPDEAAAPGAPGALPELPPDARSRHPVHVIVLACVV
jgi:uncharacterized protein